MAIYYAKIRRAEERGYLVEFPGIPGAVTQGETVDEAVGMAVDCLRTLFLGLIAMGQDIPIANRPRGRNIHPVSLPALETAKIELYRTFRASSMKKARLASGMGIPRAHVDRLFDLNHASRLNQIESAFRVLGKALVLETRDAA